MNRDKQIEEMAKALTAYEKKLCDRLPKDKCLLTSAVHAQVSCDYCKIAEFLVNAGYRKASEVARETVEAIKAEVRKKEQYVNDLFGYGGYVIATTDLEDIIRRYIFDTYEEYELKKKYESEKE